MNICTLSLSLTRPGFIGGSGAPAYDVVLTRSGDTVVTRSDEDVSPRS